jgi:pimeloyl-ACP methyl ester carboxylesterase
MGPLRRARSAAGLIVLVLTGLVAPALPAVAAGAVARSSAGTLRWSSCGGSFECSQLVVAIDPAHPERSAALAVVRQRARDRARRIGSLVFNPGGPGVPAVEFLRDAASSLPAEVRDRFDLVAFDPLGVGESDPIDCVDSLDPIFDQSFEPTTDAARAALNAAVTALAQQCAAREGDLLAHISTADAVRDLEQLRIALGDDRLSFVGSSYGTFLGASYAQAYPDRVRAFVLDGPIDPSMSARAVTLSQARGFERALDDFLAHCSKDRGCAFHHAGEAAHAYDALRARAARAPLATIGSDGRTVNQTRFDAAVLQQLYFGRAGWSSLAVALTAAEHGDASTLLANADSFVGRRADGSDDHALEAFWAISCLDGPVVAGTAAAAGLERDAVDVAPRLGAFIVNNSLACSVWTVPPVAAPGRLTATGAPPILVIGTTEDPATPLGQARALASTLERGGLLIAKGEQHTSFDNGNRCVDAIVTRYLVDRVLPRPATRC